MDNKSTKVAALTPRSLATRGFVDVVNANDLRFVGVEPSCLYDADGKRTDEVNGSRVRLMLADRDIKVKVIGKTIDQFADLCFGDSISLVDPEAILYTRQGDRWPRVAFRAADIVRVGDMQGKEA